MADATRLKEEPDPEAARLALVSDGNYDVTEASKLTKLSKSELYKLMANAELVFFQHGKRRLIPKRALHRFMAARLVGVADADAFADARQ